MRRNLRSIEYKNGKLAYRKKGEYAGPALVFIHGAVGDSQLFCHQIRHFGAKYKTLAIDLPGHGQSSASAATIDEFIDSINALIIEENIGSCVFIGHSMGGGVVLELFKRGICRCSALVLVSTAPVLPVPRKLAERLEKGDMESLAAMMIGSVFSKKVDLLLEFAKKGIGEVNISLIKNDIEICGRMDYRDMLSEIDIPVLLVANKGDELIEWSSTDYMSKSIHCSRTVVFDAPGHVPFFEEHESFNNALDSFLDSFLTAENNETRDMGGSAPVSM
jgi:pimeloyl-ACP methyl ester carboxylesterase